MASFHTEDGFGVRAVTAQQMGDVDRIALRELGPTLTRWRRTPGEAWHLYQPVDTTLTLDSLSGKLVDYWLADLDLEGRIAPSIRRGYEDAMRKLVLPAFQHLTLRKIGVARCDALLKQLGRVSYARSKRAKIRTAAGIRAGGAA